MELSSGLMKKKGLNATQIKTIAIIAMLIDHIGWGFFNKYSATGQMMHVIGRLTAPIMCFFIAQGYIHTRSIKKYFIRLILFALISQLPYVFESEGKLFDPLSFSVIYTLTLGLFAIFCFDKIKNKYLRWLAIIGIGLLSIPGDWMFFGIAFCLIFYIFRDNFKKQCIGITFVGIIEMLLIILMYAKNGISIQRALLENLFQMSIILSLPVLSFYNGERGGNKYTKWGFYIFYPLHLLIIGFIKFMI